MPAIYAHYAFGEDVIKSLPPSLREELTKFKDCYRLGFQGPDILFYHKPFSPDPIRTKGMDMHLLSAKRFFIDCAKKILAATEEKRNALKSYVAGFICHFSLDNACHGRIYQLEDTGISHGRIESEFDKYLRRQKGVKLHGNNAAKPLKNKRAVVRAAAEILEVPQSAIKRAIRTIRFINGMFVCRCKSFHKFAHRVLTKFRAEKKFGGMFLHFDDDPACDKLNPALEEDWKNAIPETAKRIEYYFENLEQIADGDIDNAFDKDYTGEKLP